MTIRRPRKRVRRTEALLPDQNAENGGPCRSGRKRRRVFYYRCVGMLSRQPDLTVTDRLQIRAFILWRATPNPGSGLRFNPSDTRFTGVLPAAGFLHEERGPPRKERIASIRKAPRAGAGCESDHAAVSGPVGASATRVRSSPSSQLSSAQSHESSDSRP